MDKYSYLIYLLPGFVLGLTFHEFSHGYVAYRLGDPTAKNAGRLTLNPLAHLDLIGSLMLIVAGFGWAKPVPVDSRYLRSPRRDMIWISLAGPIANLLFAVALTAILYILMWTGLVLPELYGRFILSVLIQGVLINIILAIFNLIPVPPLDGSRVLAGFIPLRLYHYYLQYERIAPAVFFGAMMIASLLGISLFGRVVNPVAEPVFRLLLGGLFKA